VTPLRLLPGGQGGFRSGFSRGGGAVPVAVWRLLAASYSRAVPVPVAFLAGPELVFEFANDAYRRLVGRQDLVGALGRRGRCRKLAAQGRAELICRRTGSPGQTFQGHETGLLVPRGGVSGPEQVFVECLYQARARRGRDG